MRLLFFLALPFFLIRGLRWLAIVQQKEYRLDRLLIFTKSPTGQKDFWTLFPPIHWLTRTGLKRPVRTSRMIVILAITLVLLSLMGWLIWWKLNIWLGSLALIIIYIFLPIIIVASLTPTVLVANIITQLTLQQAQQRLKQGNPLVIGITGSFGKTSTKLLVAHLLSTKYSVFATPKSHNTRYSVARAILNAYHDQQIAVIEYAAYTQGEIKTLAGWFKPQMAVITGLTSQHLELFKSVENIILAKAELIKALPLHAPVFCNAADAGAIKICEAGGAEKIINYSGDKSVIELKHMGLTNQGKLTFVWHGHTIVTQLIGLHYQENVAGAIAVAEYLEVGELDIVEALKSFVPTQAFTQIKEGKNQALIIDDGGTTNPTGFVSALQLLKVFKKQHYRTILITGGIVDLGKASDNIHQDLAIQTKPIADQVWYVGEDGLAEFKNEFKEECVVSKSEILRQLKQINQQTVILIEGRLPLWLKTIYANI